MTTQHDLAEAFRRLTATLAEAEEQPGGPERARGVRSRLLAHLDDLRRTLEGRAEKCRYHRNQLAHRCGPCRSERIGRAHDDPPPPTPDHVRALEARRLGESL